MQFIILFCFLCLLVLQQTIDGALFNLPRYNSVNEIGRSHVARRLRAPLMGRSIEDETNLIENDPNFIAFMNRRRLMKNPKKKGPLFG